jgi:hypothetical protein
VVTPPAAPKISSPSGTITTHTPTFKWTKVSTANQYYLEVYRYTPAGYVIAQTITGTCVGTACSAVSPTALTTHGNYKWRMRAGISGVWGQPSAWKMFKINP